MCHQGALLHFILTSRPKLMEILTPGTSLAIGDEKTLRTSHWFINAFIWDINTPLWHVCYRPEKVTWLYLSLCGGKILSLSVVGKGEEMGIFTGSNNACPLPSSLCLRQASFRRPRFKIQSLWQICRLTQNLSQHPPALPPFQQRMENVILDFPASLPPVLAKYKFWGNQM